MNSPALSWRLGLTALLAGLACGLGCSSFRTQMGRPLPTGTEQFAEGQSRVEDVARQLGPPSQASQLSPGFVFLYEYSAIREFQLGISVNVPILRYFKFVHAWNHLDQQALVLTFDDQGVLRSAGGGRSKESLGGGSAAQPVFVSISLSDVSRILRPADAHDWGESLLKPLPVALNSAQSLRSGEHGVQQRIAPGNAGQQTLEMQRQRTEKQKKRIKKNYQTQRP
jgi:hypothetical protein